MGWVRVRVRGRLRLRLRLRVGVRARMGVRLRARVGVRVRVRVRVRVTPITFVGREGTRRVVGVSCFVSSSGGAQELRHRTLLRRLQLLLQK